MEKNKVNKTVWAGLFVALTCVATLIMFPVPSMTNGYVNAGDALVILSAFLLGPLWGAMAAGLGSAFADIFLGYIHYFPATLIIKALMALAAGVILRRFREKHSLVAAIIASILAELIMIGGYFLYETLLYGIAGSVASLIGNSIQAVFGAVIAVVLFMALKRIRYVHDNF